MKPSQIVALAGGLFIGYHFSDQIFNACVLGIVWGFTCGAVGRYLGE